MEGKNPIFTLVDSHFLLLLHLPPHPSGSPGHPRPQSHCLLPPLPPGHGWTQQDTARIAQAQPCRPKTCSGARYSVLPHCSRPQSAASDHLGQRERVPRGPLDVHDLPGCRSYPLRPSSSLSSSSPVRALDHAHDAPRLPYIKPFPRAPVASSGSSSSPCTSQTSLTPLPWPPTSSMAGVPPRPLPRPLGPSPLRAFPDLP